MWKYVSPLIGPAPHQTRPARGIAAPSTAPSARRSAIGTGFDSPLSAAGTAAQAETITRTPPARRIDVPTRKTRASAKAKTPRLSAKEAATATPGDEGQPSA